MPTFKWFIWCRLFNLKQIMNYLVLQTNWHRKVTFQVALTQKITRRDPFDNKSMEMAFILIHILFCCFDFVWEPTMNLNRCTVMGADGFGDAISWQKVDSNKNKLVWFFLSLNLSCKVSTVVILDYCCWHVVLSPCTKCAVCI